MFYKSLLGLSVAGCLLSIAFVAGAAVVAYTVFSKAPRVAIRPPVPDSLTRAMRARRALAPDDVALYAYQPAGQEDTTLLLLTRRRTVVVTQASSLLVAVGLAALAFSGVDVVWPYFVLAFLGGSALVFDAPNRHALTFQLVAAPTSKIALFSLSSTIFSTRVDDS